MIAEGGLALLWVAAALSLLQLGFGLLALLPGTGRGTMQSMVEGSTDASDPSTALRAVPLPVPGRSIRAVAVVQALVVGLAFLALIQLFLRTDLSVELVAANSHSLKPWLYKFAGAWGNHEGSMLLWVAVLALAGAAVALFERGLEERTLIATLAAQAAIG